MADFFHFQGYISKLSDGKGHLQLDRSEQHCVSNCRKSLFFIILAGGAFFGASEAYSLTAASTASGWNLSFWPVPALWGAGLAAGALLARCLPQRLLPPIGLLVLEILLLLQPGTPWRSATAGLLAGGVLSMLPASPAGPDSPPGSPWTSSVSMVDVFRGCCCCRSCCWRCFAPCRSAAPGGCCRFCCCRLRCFSFRQSIPRKVFGGHLGTSRRFRSHRHCPPR